MSVFASLQEGVRVARLEDSPSNSLIAGGGMGGLLHALHYNHPVRGIQGAVLWGATAGAVHWAMQGVDMEVVIGRRLVAMGVLDDPAGRYAAPPVDPDVEPWWVKYTPLTRVDDEEYERIQERKRQRMKRIESGELLPGDDPNRFYAEEHSK